MTPVSAQFDSAQTQWAMPHSPYANANYSPYANANYTPVENPMRHRTGTSGSGSDGQDIIPGGEFDEPDLQQHRGLKKSYTSSRGFVLPNDIMTFPQTPHHRSLYNYQGMSESIGKDAYRNVSYSTPDHHNRSGGSDSAMDIIEQTKRMNMLHTPSQYLSSSSPTSMSTMQPSAFRLEGIPMTPDRTSNFGHCEIGNGYAQPQAVPFTPSQPQSMQFVPGPPQHMRVEHAGSALPLVNSFNGQLDGPFIPQSLRAPFVPSTGLPLSTSARSDLTVATSGGFPSTPTDPGTFGFQDSNSFAFHVKTEPGEATPAVESDIFQQQHGGNHYQTTMYSSPGQFNSFDNRRHHHRTVLRRQSQ
ncbi:hypothetical protein QFC21_002267 [Naganishia friedmannii]|uniref:Uncharacterized protein n=1 Tax=Naganishia friedmannii TaxID=89922 RepID=A0ACC2VXH6_9TREE|nr:hypothetical protein QFC21_002267 [Naganishia friedmannii]